MHKICALLAFAFATSAAQAATMAFNNFNDTATNAYAVRAANGAFVTTSGSYTGILGTFTISDSAVTNAFNSGDTAAIAAGFTAFDPVTGTFALDNLQPGVFDASESFDTKTTSNSLGGATVYTIFYQGASIATATEMFIAKLNAVFPTDPAVGAPGIGNAALNPTGVNSILAGSVGAPADPVGAGALPTYQLSAVAAVPEPSKTMVLATSLFGLLALRRRPRA
jgi:hypothetical protein